MRFEKCTVGLSLICTWWRVFERFEGVLASQIPRNHAPAGPCQVQILSSAPNFNRGASPLELPYTVPRSPLRRLTPGPWLAHGVRSHGAPNLIEGLRPSNSPTRSLARRCAGSRRARGSLTAFARTPHQTLIDGRRPSNSPTRSSLAAAPAHAGPVARSRRSLA